MTAPYKKRLKGNWQQGKTYKGDRFERQYSKEEISKFLAEMDEDYLEKHRKGKRTRDDKARLEHRIEWYIHAIEQYERKEWGGSFLNMLRDGLKKAREQYNRKFGQKKEEQ